MRNPGRAPETKPGENKLLKAFGVPPDGLLTCRNRPAVDGSRLAVARATLMSAGADNLDLIGDALAMGAAIFRFLRGNAITGCVGAFLGIGHGPPLPLA